MYKIMMLNIRKQKTEAIAWNLDFNLLKERLEQITKDNRNPALFFYMLESDVE